MNPAQATIIRGQRKTIAVTVVAPLADAAAIESAIGLSLNIGLANGSPSGSPTHAAGGWVVTRKKADHIWGLIDGVLGNSVVRMDESTNLPAYPWIYPGQEITLTNASIAFTDCSKWSAFRDLTISTNSPTASRRFCNIAGTFDSILFDRCTFNSTATATKEGASTNGRVTELKIRNCNFESTTHRVFDCDNLQVDSLTIQDNTGTNINSTLFYFPATPATVESSGLIERNEVFCDPEHVAVPVGSYSCVGLIRLQSVICRDNRTEGLKTAAKNNNAGSWDLRCSEIVNEREVYINCGSATTEPSTYRDRRILNCKGTAGLGGQFTGRWVDCSWLIEPAYFQAQNLPVPKIALGNTFYRHCELVGCTIDVDELLAFDANERYIPSFAMTNSTVRANTLTITSGTWGGLFWFQHEPDSVTGDFTFENVDFEFGSIPNTQSLTMLMRVAALATGTQVLFDTVTFQSASPLDFWFMLDAGSTDTVWVLNDLVFTVSAITQQQWVVGRQPDSLTITGAS
jgi:hypothetical protein